jgi:hypothetical protein
MSSETSGQLARLLEKYDRFLAYEQETGHLVAASESIDVVIHWLDNKEMSLTQSRYSDAEYFISWINNMVLDMISELAQRKDN